jgi:hypothetical protein
VLYDAIIYDQTRSSSSETPSFIIECDGRALEAKVALNNIGHANKNDATATPTVTPALSTSTSPSAGLMRHLKKYILSNNVLVENVSHEYSVYRIWGNTPDSPSSSMINEVKIHSQVSFLDHHKQKQQQAA